MRAVTSRRKHKPAARPHIVVQVSQSRDSIMCAPQNLHSPHPQESSSELQTSVTEQGKNKRRERGESKIKNVNQNQNEKEFYQKRNEEGNHMFMADFSSRRPYHSPLRVEMRNVRLRDSK